jgi:hypothetical protein
MYLSQSSIGGGKAHHVNETPCSLQRRFAASVHEIRFSGSAECFSLLSTPRNRARWRRRQLRKRKSSKAGALWTGEPIDDEMHLCMAGKAPEAKATFDAAHLAAQAAQQNEEAKKRHLMASSHH